MLSCFGPQSAPSEFVGKNLITAAVSLFVFLLPIAGQQPLVGVIQGTVTDRHNAPVAYANLTAANIDTVEPQRMMTSADENGFYQFVEVPEGRYSIVVRKKGYRDYRVPVVTVRGGETLPVPVRMSPAGRH